jgi:hypothetical protein
MPRSNLGQATEHKGKDRRHRNVDVEGTTIRPVSIVEPCQRVNQHPTPYARSIA